MYRIGKKVSIRAHKGLIFSVYVFPCRSLLLKQVGASTLSISTCLTVTMSTGDFVGILLADDFSVVWEPEVPLCKWQQIFFMYMLWLMRIPTGQKDVRTGQTRGICVGLLGVYAVSRRLLQYVESADIFESMAIEVPSSHKQSLLSIYSEETGFSVYKMVILHRRI